MLYFGRINNSWSIAYFLVVHEKKSNNIKKKKKKKGHFFLLQFGPTKVPLSIQYVKAPRQSHV
jgi:hypothetical protein